MSEPMRRDICKLEDLMASMDQAEIPIRHYHCNGFYAREMVMPPNCTLVGKIHKSEHLCIISEGTVTVVSEEFEGTVSAPYTYVSKPGAKRAIVSHTQVVWTTVHMTDETDIETLERDLVTESYQALAEDQRKKLEK